MQFMYINYLFVCLFWWDWGGWWWGGGRVDDLTAKRIADQWIDDLPGCHSGVPGTAIHKLDFCGLDGFQRLSEPSAAPFLKHRSRYELLCLRLKFSSWIGGCSPSEESSAAIISWPCSEVSPRNPLPPALSSKEAQKGSCPKSVALPHWEDRSSITVYILLLAPIPPTLLQYQSNWGIDKYLNCPTSEVASSVTSQLHN